MKLTEDKKVRIFRKDRATRDGGTFATYCMGVSSKKQDGSYVNGFIDCSFKNGVEVNNKTDITIQNAFPTVRESNGRTFVSWMITEFEVVGEGQAPVNANQDPDMGFINVPEGLDNDLPFAAPSR